jgi:hypothetical protein
MTGSTDKFIEHSLRTSMFFPSSRLFVAGNPKAAGTSLRWWLLEVHGVDVAGIAAASLWGESAPYQTVWDADRDFRYTWNNLSTDEQHDALTASDVLTVQTIRNPVRRTFSAWAGKYLTLEPYYYERLPPEFDRPLGSIDSGDQVSTLFENFLRSLTAHVARMPDWQGVDVHFWPQNLLLRRSPTGQTLLLRQEAMKAGLEQIAHQLARHGIEPTPMPNINESVVPYQADFISHAALEMIIQLYGDDFAAWDYRAEIADARKQELDLAWLNDVRGRNRRYGVVHQAAMRSRKRVQALERELQAAQDREAALHASHSWRITRPIRWVSAKVRHLETPDNPGE